MPIQPPEISRQTFIGRKDEMGIIERAISDKGHLRIVNIQGAGGIGKTSVLREIERRYKDRNDLLVTQLIDFFDISTNTPRGFLDELIRMLPTKTHAQFKNYREARDRLDDIETACIGGATLEYTETEFFEAFKSCYNFVSSEKRIIVLIDTFEMVQETFGNWLAEWLKGLENTVVIIAGRKNKDWQNDIAAQVGSKSVDYILLKEFSKDDTKELSTISEIWETISDEDREKLQLLSGGLPILLILAVDKKWPGGYPKKDKEQKELENQTFTIDKYNITQLREMDAEQLKSIQNDFCVELVQLFKELGYYSMVVNYMALVYKYFTVDILVYLTDMNNEQAQSLLDNLVNWTFMKYDRDTETYQLHDLIRELIMAKVWPILNKKIDPTGDEAKRIYQETVKFYSNLLEEILNQETEISTNKVIDQEKRREVRRKLMNLKRRRQQYEAQQVYYWICADLQEGLLRYRELFVDNVWGREKDAIRLLKKEQGSALKELNKDYPECEYKLEEARIRIAMEGKYNEGLEILKNLHETESQEKNPYFYSDVLFYQGIANGYKGNFKEAKQKFNDTINILTQLKNKLKEPENLDKLMTRRIFRSFARVYGNMGYAFMMAGWFSESIKAFQHALNYCVSKELLIQKASYLNESAFAYARLGDLERARYYWEEGLKIRESLVLDYYIGLSYNTRGLIEYLADQSHEGTTYCNNALKVFENIKEQRGIGLSHRAIGGLLSRTGEREGSVDILNQAEKHLKQAESLFIEGGYSHEPIILAETYDRLGLLYYHRRDLSKIRGESNIIIKEFLTEAKGYFEKSLQEYKKAGSTLNQMSTLLKLGKIYFEEGHIEKASQQLKLVQCILVQEIGIPYEEIKCEELDEIYDTRKELLYPIGKLERGKARLAFTPFQETKDIGMLKQATEHFALACAILEKFSKNSFAYKSTLNEINKVYGALDKNQREVFKAQAKIALQEHKLENYSEILKRIEDADIILSRRY